MVFSKGFISRATYHNIHTVFEYMHVGFLCESFMNKMQKETYLLTHKTPET